MSTLVQVRRQLVWLTMALLFMLGGSLGFVVAQLTNGLQESDLLPGRIRGCTDGAVTRIIAANLIASDTYSDDEANALRTLPPACLDPDVYGSLDPVLLDLLARSPVNP